MHTQRKKRYRRSFIFPNRKKKGFWKHFFNRLTTIFKQTRFVTNFSSADLFCFTFLITSANWHHLNISLEGKHFYWIMFSWYTLDISFFFNTLKMKLKSLLKSHIEVMTVLCGKTKSTSQFELSSGLQFTLRLINDN